MPELALVGHQSTGHDACPPVPAAEGAFTVHAEGRPVLREGDAFQPHRCDIHSPHQGFVAKGAPHVHINGRPVARRGDLIQCGVNVDRIAEGLPSVHVGNCGGEDYGRELIFGMLRDPKDRLILCLEEIAAAESELASERDRPGWIYLRDFMAKWLSKKGYAIQDRYDNGGQEPAYIDWNWMMGFLRFYRKYREIMQPDYMFSPAAKAKLAAVLQADGAFAGEGMRFDHIALPWDKQRAHAFQNISMALSWYELICAITGWPSPGNPDGLQATVANVTIFALASGETRVLKNGARQIRVRRVAFFIHDGFDFSGDQPLGWWSCEHKSFRHELFGGTLLTNADFRRFREHTGYGCDFRIMTRPELVWEGDILYDVH